MFYYFQNTVIIKRSLQLVQINATTQRKMQGFAVGCQGQLLGTRSWPFPSLPFPSLPFPFVSVSFPFFSLLFSSLLFFSSFIEIWLTWDQDFWAESWGREGAYLSSEKGTQGKGRLRSVEVPKELETRSSGWKEKVGWGMTPCQTPSNVKVEAHSFCCWW